jgi:Domain of unknown function (DUF4258)
VIDPAVPANLSALRKLVQACLENGRVVYHSHARARMNERTILLDEVNRVLVGGRYELSDFKPEQNGWSYTAESQKVRVVFAATADDDGNAILVITAVRLK